MILFVDTETTGVPDVRLRADDPAQPRLVQLGMILADDAGAEWATVELIVRQPEGTSIPAGASKVHGITDAIAAAVGVPLLVAVAAFTNLRSIATEVVAYNLPFDEGIMSTSIARTGRPSTLPDVARRSCLMERVTPIVNLPPTDRMIAAGFGGKPKAPKLIEAYRHFFGRDFEGAHGALADVRATKAIWDELNRRGEVA